MEDLHSSASLENHMQHTVPGLQEPGESGAARTLTEGVRTARYEPQEFEFVAPAIEADPVYTARGLAGPLDEDQWIDGPQRIRERARRARAQALRAPPALPPPDAAVDAWMLGHIPEARADRDRLLRETHAAADLRQEIPLPSGRRRPAPPPPRNMGMILYTGSNQCGACNRIFWGGSRYCADCVRTDRPLQVRPAPCSMCGSRDDWGRFDGKCRECYDELDGASARMSGPVEYAAAPHTERARASVAPSHSTVEPARVRIGFDGVPIPTVAQTEGCTWRGKRKSQLNGSHGEFTESDDVERHDAEAFCTDVLGVMPFTFGGGGAAGDGSFEHAVADLAAASVVPKLTLGPAPPPTPGTAGEFSGTLGIGVHNSVSTPPPGLAAVPSRESALVPLPDPQSQLQPLGRELGHASFSAKPARDDRVAGKGTKGKGKSGKPARDAGMTPPAAKRGQGVNLEKKPSPDKGMGAPPVKAGPRVDARTTAPSVTSTLSTASGQKGSAGGKPPPVTAGKGAPATSPQVDVEGATDGGVASSPSIGGKGGKGAKHGSEPKRSPELESALDKLSKYICTTVTAEVAMSFAIYDKGLFVYKLHGTADGYLTKKGNFPVKVTLPPYTDILRGYAEITPGFYRLMDPPKEVTTVEEYDSWCDDPAHCTVLRHCADVRRHPPVRILNSKGTLDLDIPGGEVVYVEAIHNYLLGRLGDVPVTDHNYRYASSLLTREFAADKGWPEVILQGVLRYYIAHRVVSIIAQSHPVVRSAIMLSALQGTQRVSFNLPLQDAYLEAYAEVRAEGTALITGGRGRQHAESLLRAYAWNPGYGPDGIWLDPATRAMHDLGDDHPDTARFKWAAFRGNSWIRVAVAGGRPGEFHLQLGAVDHIPRDKRELPYHTRVFGFFPELDTRMPRNVAVTPISAAGGWNKRCTQAVPLEAKKFANQLRIVAFMVLLDARLGGIVLAGMLSRCNGKRALSQAYEASATDAQADLAFWRDVRLIPELGAFSPAALCTIGPSWDATVTPPEDKMLALAQIGAASALISRIRHAESNSDRAATRITWVGVAFVICLGILMCSAWAKPSAAATAFTWVSSVGLITSAVPWATKFLWQRLVGPVPYQVDRNGFVHYWTGGGIFGDAWRQIQAMVLLQHPKSRLYRAMVATLSCVGLDYKINKPTLAQWIIQVQAKPREWAKFLKDIRMVGATGMSIVILNRWMASVKEWFCGCIDMVDALALPAFFFPIIPCIHEVCYSRPADMVAAMTCWVNVAYYMSFSDDGQLVFPGLGAIVYLGDDAASADTTIGALHLGLMFCLFRVCGFDVMEEASVADLTGLWEFKHPEDSKSVASFLPTHANMPSGTPGTTAHQNHQKCAFFGGFWALVSFSKYQEECRYAAHAHERDQANVPVVSLTENLPNLVSLAAVACGGQSTCDLSQSAQQSTFLKKTIWQSTDGKWCIGSVLGVIIRGFGAVYGDVNARMLSLTPSAWKLIQHDPNTVSEMYLRGVVAGWCNEPSSPFWDALRTRFPPSTQLVHADADERYKLEQRLAGVDYSSYHVGLDQYVERYGGTLDQWEQFCALIPNMGSGCMITSPIVDLVLMKDYGYA